MKKNLFIPIAALLLATPAIAEINLTETDKADINKVAEEPVESEFMSDERTEEGFLTQYLNQAIAQGMEKLDKDAEVEYGRTITKYVSAPKFGGYFIGKYAANNRTHDNGFSQRLVRFYVDGTILNDFAYRIQIQTNNSSFHMKDFFLEWKKYPEFKVKVGQYKRAFGLENPMNPWDVGVGDYSQLTKKMTGHSDFIGAESGSNGGRDQGLQIQGDLFPAKDGHRYIHYQVMVSNGQGINAGDANSQKDITGTIHIQPIKGLFFGFYGWTGNYTCTGKEDGYSAYKGVTVKRNRYLLFAKYEANDWTFRGEYAHSTGHKISDHQSDGTWKGNGRADAWYATVGIPCNNWLKTYIKYDVYRDGAEWGTTKSIYSICPNIQLHKNLMFQPQINYIYDRGAQKKNQAEFWVETYVRF